MDNSSKFINRIIALVVGINLVVWTFLLISLGHPKGMNHTESSTNLEATNILCSWKDKNQNVIDVYYKDEDTHYYFKTYTKLTSLMEQTIVVEITYTSVWFNVQSIEYELKLSLYDQKKLGLYVGEE